MTTIISENDTTNARLPATVCEPWCQDGNGHTDEWHPDDQWCHSEPRQVFLSRYPLVTMNDGTKSRDDMRALLEREAYEGSPFVSLGHGDDQGTHLTPDEAQRLGETLIQLAATARA